MLQPLVETDLYRVYQLPSGLRIAYYPEPSAISYAGYIVHTGAAQDPNRYHGMAHLVEHMLFKGTPLRKAKSIIHRMEVVGADLNAYTTKEETFLYAAFGQKYAIRTLQLLTDIVLHSHIPEEELKKEKTVIIEEINSYRDSPAEMIFDEFEEHLFHGTALGHNILGSTASVERITSKAARDFRQHHYRADNMILCLRGQFDLAWIFDFCNYHFRSVPPTKIERPPLSWDPTSALLPNKRHVTHRFDTYQTHQLMGGFAYSIYDERRIVLTLLNNILGGPGMNSRLNLSLREEAGLVYSVDSNYTIFSGGGLFSIYFGCAHRDAKEATQKVLDELTKLSSIPLEADELANAKRQLMGQLAISGDARENAFLSMGKSVLFYGKYDALDVIERRIQAITAEQLQSTAQELFAPERLFTLTYH